MPEIGKLRQVQQGTIHISSVQTAIIEWQGTPYEGSYSVTPGAEEQVLATKNLRCTDDITIAPIPNNYGLITWDGSTLTVS